MLIGMEFNLLGKIRHHILLFSVAFGIKLQSKIYLKVHNVGIVKPIFMSLSL